METGMLNREISDILASLGHTDELIVADAGFPLPLGVRVADLSLAAGKPTVPEVVQEILKYFSVEKIVLADETRAVSPSCFEKLTGLFGADAQVETMSHSAFKLHSRQVKAVIRTGDFTAYANILLVSGSGDRWYKEKSGG